MLVPVYRNHEVGSAYFCCRGPNCRLRWFGKLHDEHERARRYDRYIGAAESYVEFRAAGNADDGNRQSADVDKHDGVHGNAFGRV